MGNQEWGSVKENLSVAHQLADQFEDATTSCEGLAAGGSKDNDNRMMPYCVKHDQDTANLESKVVKQRRLTSRKLGTLLRMGSRMTFSMSLPRSVGQSNFN